jgi:integrase
MAPIRKKHLPFSEWSAMDRALWNAAFEPGDDFDEPPGNRLSKATIIGLRTAYARFLGFLASHDPQKLCLAPEYRPEQESIKIFVDHLRQSCRDTSIASLLHKLRLALMLICPGTDWSWLKAVAKRIEARATPRTLPNPELTSADLYEVGIRLMAMAEDSEGSARVSSKAEALTYRDGLIIALLAVVPLRRRTLTALTIDQHLAKIGEHWLLDIPAADTKTHRALEFPLPEDLSRYITLFIVRFRGRIPGAANHQGLWPSTRGRPMDAGSIYDAVRRRTMEALGFPVNLHRFRLAAGNLWSIADPENVRGVKDLLGHTSFGITEKHYIGAQSRLAGRALANVLRSFGQ